MNYSSSSEQETQAIAAKLAANVRPGAIFLLHGTLGAGKTVFARAFLRKLANDPTLEVPSPTFTLVQTYDTDKGPVWHFDLYRMEKPEDLFELGWEDALAEKAILLIEWPERLGDLRPEKATSLFMTIEKDGRRLIRVAEPEEVATSKAKG